MREPYAEYVAGKAIIIQADARHLPLPDESVDLVVTSPPFFGHRNYQDDGQDCVGQVGQEATANEFVAALLDATAEMMRVLKSTGSIFVNLGDRYAAKSLMGLPWRYAHACTDRLGLVLRAEIIWSKTNGLPESVTDRVRRSHETWFHFAKQTCYFSTIDALREAHTMKPQRRLTKHKAQTNGLDRESGWTGALRDEPGFDGHPLGKLPGSVWSIPTEPLRIPAAVKAALDLPDHFAAFPQEWPRRIILGWSPEGGVVLDPFGGTGTTAMVAQSLGRVGISGDLSGDYGRLARWRAGATA